MQNFIIMNISNKADSIFICVPVGDNVYATQLGDTSSDQTQEESG